ncbi:MAG: cupin domain-containing protein [Candidatus Sericytochromatia bacterium]|nr:cupin domain-containing protein [Candidatus Tanganyikabacteria bacterium]
MPFNDPGTKADKPYKINLADVPWESWGHGRFESDDLYVDRHVRSERISLIVTRLPPGGVNCPFHFHHKSEELFYILEGTGTLRYGTEESEVRAGDVVACPPGPAGAHQFVNTGTEPLSYLAISTEEEVDLCEYPDSGKVAIHAVPRGAQAGFRGVFKQAAKVDYFEGEDATVPG